MRLARGANGFSLVELMIVVAIVGVLAALAVPKYQKFQSKARQAEVKANLSHIVSLETAYYGDTDTYGAIPAYGPGGTCAPTAAANPMGFAVGNCAGLRYTYSTTVATATAFTAQGTSGTGVANKVFAGCATADTWAVTENSPISNTSNGMAACN